jgi:outer membrane protein assembly factor BamD
MLIKILFVAIFTSMLFTSCSKDIEEYNKPAIYWYSKIIESISDSNLDKADDYYGSLQGEHIGSPLLPEATMILALAHMQNDEFILSEHFFNEYVTRYANPNEKEFAEYMKLKSKYLALPNPRRDQVLINRAILDANNFKKSYPNSMYYKVVDSMLTDLYMADAALNWTISDLYKRLDKPKASKYYSEIKPQPWIKWSDIKRASSPWYREWFEGDGTESWYGFLIPDTKSVVSRNSIKDNNSSKI